MSERNVYLIIGSGRLGSVVADLLSKTDKEVLIIDSNSEAFRKLPTTFTGETLEADGTDIATLDSLNMDKVVAALVLTNNSNTNIMISQMLKTVYKIPKVISRLNDPEKKAVYDEYDIDVVCPAILSANEIGKLLKEND